MKLTLIDTIILALMVAVLMIGAHQIFTLTQAEGFKIAFLKSYWIFMILLILTVIYKARKNRQDPEKKDSRDSSASSKKTKQTKTGKSKKK